jgi:hypothetical protein
VPNRRRGRFAVACVSLEVGGFRKIYRAGISITVFQSCDRSERPQQPKRPESPLRRPKCAPARSKFIKRWENFQVNCESARACHRNGSMARTREKSLSLRAFGVPRSLAELTRQTACPPVLRPALRTRREYHSAPHRNFAPFRSAHRGRAQPREGSLTAFYGVGSNGLQCRFRLSRCGLEAPRARK